MDFNYTPPLQYFIRQSFKRFINLCLITIGLIVLIRFYEILIISRKAGYPSGSTIELLSGIRYDLLLALRVSLYLLIPFLLIDHYNRKYARIFFTTVVTIVVISEVLLLRYFATTRIPLGADLLGYTGEEIHQTVGASGELSFSSILPALLLGGLSVYAFHKWHSRLISGWELYLVSFSLFIAFLPFVDANPDPLSYRSEFSMNIAANKFNLFCGSMSGHFNQKDVSTNFELNISENKSGNNKAGSNQGSETVDHSSAEQPDQGNEFTYLSQDYPFLHQERTPDLLGPFFQPSKTPPSIVFIVVESLGRAYSGPGAYLGSFTPFLDSLMQKSLYWENCLSTSGRTFSVLPSLLASLPFADKGFADLGDKMPEHLGLISLLKKNAGYSSAFYYGGNPKFDSMEPFMRRQGTSKIVGIYDFSKDYQQLPSDKNGFSWGYGDKEIFRKYLTDLKYQETDKRVDVMLTLAMHNPFMVPNQEAFNALFEKRMNELNLSAEQKKYNRQYTAQFASMLYFDNALKYFFDEFSKLKSFKNTLFILTGDHRMPEIPISTQVDRFHVPLVIYSPLLKKGETFSSLVTHFDVTPSLLAFLQNRLNVKLPTVSSWIGHGLDTQIPFRSLYAYPLKRNTGELTDYYNGEYFLTGTNLYRIESNLNIEPYDNAEVREQLQKEFDNYKSKNNFVKQGNHLIPDSLRKYIR